MITTDILHNVLQSRCGEHSAMTRDLVVMCHSGSISGCVCHLTCLSSAAGLLQPVHGIIIGETACADHFLRPIKSVRVNGDRHSAGYLSIMNK